MALRTQYEDMDVAEFVYKTQEEKFLEFMQGKQFVEILRKSDIENFFKILPIEELHGRRYGFEYITHKKFKNNCEVVRTVKTFVGDNEETAKWLIYKLQILLQHHKNLI